jgi:hypothetical protein
MEFDNTPAPGDTPAPAQDPNVQVAPLAEQLVGDGKPFKDVEALAKGKTDADSFIEQLKNENAGMRDAMAKSEEAALKAATMSQVLEAVRTLSGSGDANDPTPVGDVSEDGNQPALSEQDILNLVQRTLEKDTATRTQQDNFDSVRKTFLGTYKDSDKARLEYKATAEALGITEKELDSFARMNPELVVRAAGLKPASNTPTPSYLASNKNSAGGEPNAIDAPRDNVWWEEQRKAKGNKWYFDTKIQQAYWRDVQALGDSFLEKG